MAAVCKLRLGQDKQTEELQNSSPSGQHCIRPASELPSWAVQASECSLSALAWRSCRPHSPWPGEESLPNNQSQRQFSGGRGLTQPQLLTLTTASTLRHPARRKPRSRKIKWDLSRGSGSDGKATTSVNILLPTVSPAQPPGCGLHALVSAAKQEGTSVSLLSLPYMNKAGPSVPFLVPLFPLTNWQRRGSEKFDSKPS